MQIRKQSVPVPQPDEVLIRVEKAGICGSELSGYLGQNSLRKPPLVMGHEFAGIVESAGSSVRRFQAGDRVTANPLISCGHCHYCRTGAAQLCPDRSLVGAHRPGAYAEYVTIPEKNVYPLAAHTTAAEGALTEPLACAVHVCRLMKLTPLDRLLIVGAGPIGLFVLQAAQVFGLRDIVILDLNAARLEIAKELGGITATRLEEVDEAIIARGFDAAVDAVGVDSTRVQCVEAVKHGGRVNFTGLHSAESKLPINHIIRNEIVMTGAFAYAPEDFEAALDWLQEGRINLLPWTAEYPLEEGRECFEKLLSDPGKIAKIMLDI